MGMIVNPYRHATSTIDGTLGSTDAGILAAVYFTVSATVVTVVGQKNVSSVTRQASGVYRITFSSALANTNYGMMGACRAADFTNDKPMIVQPNRFSTGGNNTYSTTTVDIACQVQSEGTATATDPIKCAAIIFDPSAVSASNYKAAASWTVSGTTVTLQRQLNVASMSRHAAGVYRTTFTSALSDANYSEFGCSRYADATNIAVPLFGQNRNTTIPSNLHSTAALDLCTGLLNTQLGGNFDTGRGSVLISKSNVAPRGTIARVRFSVTAGVAAIIDSYNVSSITVQGTGLYRVNFTLPCPDNDFTVLCTGKWSGSTDDDTPLIGANRNSSASRNLYATTGVDIAASSYGSGSFFHADFVNVWVVKPWLM